MDNLCFNPLALVFLFKTALIWSGGKHLFPHTNKECLIRLYWEGGLQWQLQLLFQGMHKCTHRARKHAWDLPEKGAFQHPAHRNSFQDEPKRLTEYVTTPHPFDSCQGTCHSFTEHSPGNLHRKEETRSETLPHRCTMGQTRRCQVCAPTGAQRKRHLGTLSRRCLCEWKQLGFIETREFTSPFFA